MEEQGVVMEAGKELAAPSFTARNFKVTRVGIELIGGQPMASFRCEDDNGQKVTVQLHDQVAEMPAFGQTVQLVWSPA